MWKHWASGVLGILVILSPYLGLPWNVHKILLVIMGMAIATLSFWSASEKQSLGAPKDGQNELEKTLL